MPTMEEFILERAGPFADVPALQPALAAITRALDAHTRMKTKAAEVARDTHRTPIGKRDVMQKFIGANAHEVVRIRKSVDVMRAKLAERRAKLMPPPPDPTNVASAVMKMGMLQMLREMKNPGERLKLLLAPDADPRFMEAVLEVPNVMSGINDQARELIVTNVIEKRHPGALAQIERVEEAIELVDVAARVAFNTGRDAAEFPSDDVFSKFVETSVGATGALEADLNNKFADLANAAAAA
jgi:hypothetical protein